VLVAAIGIGIGINQLSAGIAANVVSVCSAALHLGVRRLPADAERGLAPSGHQWKFCLSQIFSRRYSCTCAI
jgi:hypothetical protein